MSPVYLASGVVVIACIAFMAVGAAYKWDVMSPGYGLWTRAVGVVALVGIVVTAVWDRLGEPKVAIAAAVVGVSLSAGFVWAHRLLSRGLVSARGVDGTGSGSDLPKRRR